MPPVKPRFANQSRVTLPGSEREAFTATAPPVQRAIAASVPPPPPTKPFTVSVVVRRKSEIDTKALAKGKGRLSRAEYQKKHGPDPASLKLVKAFAAEYGLKAEPLPGANTRTLQLTGTTANMQKAFGVELSTETVEGGSFRVRKGAISIPQELEGHVVAVLGLDNRPQAQPHFRTSRAEASPSSYTPIQVAELYSYPTPPSAKGQTIGLIELGGGFRTADIKAYFKTLGQTTPTVTAVSVDKAKNTPGDPNGPDGEVMLDIEVAAAVAPGAKIAVYFAPNTDQGFIDAITTAVHDKTNKPSVISISWGGPEPSWTVQAMQALDAACQSAATLGVTITVAAGDDGSTDGTSGSGNNVDFPGSSPHVLTCGGTKLEGTGTTIASEVVWNELSANEGATGGGVSTVFPLPAWQSSANVPKLPNGSTGRGVPDVSGDADPSTGYTIRVDGQTMVIGGTSAVAPLWAGLIALSNAINKSDAGFVNPTLYAAKSKKAFHDITSGNNGGYEAGPGWDPCSGLGSPIGISITKLFATTTTTTKPPAKRSTKTAAKKASKSAPAAASA
jgi:kumamolisin